MIIELVMVVCTQTACSPQALMQWHGRDAWHQCRAVMDTMSVTVNRPYVACEERDAKGRKVLKPTT